MPYQTQMRVTFLWVDLTPAQSRQNQSSSITSVSPTADVGLAAARRTLTADKIQAPSPTAARDRPYASTSSAIR